MAVPFRESPVFVVVVVVGAWGCDTIAAAAVIQDVVKWVAAWCETAAPLPEACLVDLLSPLRSRTFF